MTPIAATVTASAHPEMTPAELIESLAGQGFTLCKCADDLEPAREGLTLDEALAIAAEDPALIAVTR